MKFKKNDVIELNEVQTTEVYADSKAYTYNHVKIDCDVMPDDEPEHWYTVDAIPCDAQGNIIGPESKGSPIHTNEFKRNLSR